MSITKKRSLRRIFAGILCMGILVTGAQPCAAAAYGYDEYGDPIVTATPVPDSQSGQAAQVTPAHSSYYNQAADTDSIDGWPTGPNIEAQAAVLMDVNTEAVLYSKNADTRLYPASITKIMTLLLTFEALDQGKIKLEDPVTVSAYASSMGGSQVFLAENEVQTLETLIKCIAVASGNDASVAVGETRQEMSPRFEQTDAAIALKADQTEVHALSTRVQSAEQKITPQAITATVAASALYAFEKYEGRNYCLESDGPFLFTDNRYYDEDGSATYLVQKTLPVSDDLFSHSSSGSAIRISLDIQRQNVDASEATTPGIYSGFWVYYQYMDAGVLKTSGLGWYLRTTDASFVASDEDWVRLRYGPLNLTSYNPVAIAYFALGTASANGTTGTVRFRNVKLSAVCV